VSVDTGGKKRKITVPSGNFSLLKPLHKAIYNRLSDQSWLLRGKESINVFKRFSRVSGEEFVSGDYESATDNLNNEVTRHLLANILMRTRSVPQGISLMAMDSLSLPISMRRSDGTTRSVEQKSGQMMGYLLSFPLLCLINYLTFRYAVPRDIPVKINGDDIVFRCKPEEKERWFRLVGISGLTLSVGKTMVSSRFFTLNSSIFEGRSSGCATIPFFRSSAFFPKSKDPEAVMGLRGRYQSFCPGFTGDNRRYLRVEFLRLNRAAIDVTRRSVSRGLGIPCDYDILVRSGQWARESWYLSMEKESPLPAFDSEFSCLPTGYKCIKVPRITKEHKLASEGVSAAWLDSAWRSKFVDTVQLWFDRMRHGTYDWHSWYLSRTKNALFRARLLKVSVRNATRYLRPKRSLFNDDNFKSQKYTIWVRDDFQANLHFSSAPDLQSGSVGGMKFEVVCGPKRAVSQEFVSVDDVRNYFRPCFDTGEVFFGEGRSITTSSDVGISFGPTEFTLKTRCASAPAVRVFSRGGVGFAPPSCLL